MNTNKKLPIIDKLQFFGKIAYLFFKINNGNQI